MKDRNNSERTVQRREVIKGAATAGLIAATGMRPFAYAAETHTAGRDSIQRENAKPGTRDWLLTKTRTVPGKVNGILTSGSSPWIEGYCSATCANAYGSPPWNSRSPKIGGAVSIWGS